MKVSSPPAPSTAVHHEANSAQSPLGARLPSDQLSSLQGEKTSSLETLWTCIKWPFITAYEWITWLFCCNSSPESIGQLARTDPKGFAKQLAANPEDTSRRLIQYCLDNPEKTEALLKALLPQILPHLTQDQIVELMCFFGGENPTSSMALMQELSERLDNPEAAPLSDKAQAVWSVGLQGLSTGFEELAASLEQASLGAREAIEAGNDFAEKTLLLDLFGRAIPALLQAISKNSDALEMLTSEQDKSLPALIHLHRVLQDIDEEAFPILSKCMDKSAQQTLLTLLKNPESLGVEFDSNAILRSPLIRLLQSTLERIQPQQDAILESFGSPPFARIFLEELRTFAENSQRVQAFVERLETGISSHWQKALEGLPPSAEAPLQARLAVAAAFLYSRLPAEVLAPLNERQADLKAFCFGENETYIRQALELLSGARPITDDVPEKTSEIYFAALDARNALLQRFAAPIRAVCNEVAASIESANDFEEKPFLRSLFQDALPNVLTLVCNHPGELETLFRKITELQQSQSRWTTVTGAISTAWTGSTFIRVATIKILGQLSEEKNQKTFSEFMKNPEAFGVDLDQLTLLQRFLNEALPNLVDAAAEGELEPLVAALESPLATHLHAHLQEANLETLQQEMDAAFAIARTGQRR